MRLGVGGLARVDLRGAVVESVERKVKMKTSCGWLSSGTVMVRCSALSVRDESLQPGSPLTVAVTIAPRRVISWTSWLASPGWYEAVAEL